MRFSDRVGQLIHSPIGAAHALTGLRTNDRALLDLSQAAPSFPPSKAVLEQISEAIHRPDTGRYAPQPGLPALREAFAQDLNRGYDSNLGHDSILITAGCNQAFCITASALTSPGDEAILVAPFYFNHDMWLQIEGVRNRYLNCGPELLPDPDELQGLITAKTKLITLVTPGNPTGQTVPKQLIHQFAEIARENGIALILDETYRSFRRGQGTAHDLFQDPAWGDHIISLHSFSKDFAIPGYRCGAVVGGPAVITEALKVLDCISISAPRIGQEAALAGLRHAQEWRLNQVTKVKSLEQQFLTAMSSQPGGFSLKSSGAYFGWVEHPRKDLSSEEVVTRLVLENDVLAIPGTAFTPTDQSMLRLSFANLDSHEIEELPARLNEFSGS
ncbi:MAG: aminotransferase [Actinobacteria bacterium TMED172]|nr:MAG: aminotransferase [Actinobacteria bacterium TMED172]|tara:strand:- start:4721 stop:5881 length:1161 start_codon:yes stop_codon:yes gene_type:complete